MTATQATSAEITAQHIETNIQSKAFNDTFKIFIPTEHIRVYSLSVLTRNRPGVAGIRCCYYRNCDTKHCDTCRNHQGTR